MNRHLKEFLRKATAIVAAVATAAGPTARGDVLLSWDFAGKTGSETTVTAGTIASNLGVGSGVISRGAGLTASANGDRFNASNWAVTNIANAISGNDYMEFSLNFNNTHSFSIDDIAFKWERSATGNSQLALRSSLDAYAADIQTFTIVDSTLSQSFTATLGGATYAGLKQNVTFRFYGWAESTSGTGGFEGTGADLVVNGTTTLLEVTPSGDPIYWDANGTTAGIGGTGTWATASALFSTAEPGTDATTRADANPLIFGGSTGTVTVSDTVNANAGLSFATTGYTLTGGTVSLGGANAAANTITTAAATAIAIDSVLAGSTGLTKAGPGTLTLSGANTYSGGTIVSAGSLVGTTSSLQGAITNNAAVTFDQATDGAYAGIMGGSGSLTKLGAGNVTLSGANTYSGGTTVSAGTLTGSTSSLQGAISNNAAVVFDQASSGAYAGVMSGTGSLTKSGSGNLTLSGANTYSGGTTVSAGTLTGSTTSLRGAITNNAAVVFDQAGAGTYSGAMTGTGSLTKSGSGNVTLSGANTYSGGTTASAGTLTGSTTSLQGGITNNAAVVFDQGTDGTYSGVMSGSGTLTKRGTGSVTLSGVNDYSGGTTLAAGTLVAGGSTALGSGAVTLTGGSLDATDGVVVGNALVANATSVGGFIISEYVEGNSNNKYIELYNGTGATINLSEYRLSLFGNGVTTADPSFALNAIGAGETLAAGATIVIANSSAVLTLPAGVTAYTTASSLTFFNGDDALALQLADGTNVDIFGRIGNDPGTSWTAGGNETVNQTLVRNADVRFGVSQNPTGTGPSAFTTLGTEWTRYPIDTVSNLGSHTMNLPTGGSVTIGSTAANASVTYSGSLALTSNAALSAAAGGTTEFSGAVSGSGGIAKVGAGKVVLSGTNTYTGGTTVNAGTLSVSADANLGGPSGGITLGGGRLEMTSGFTLGSGRTITAATGTASTLAVTSGTVAFAGPFAGSGNLDKAGAGTLSLGNASGGYTGTFTISAGTLEVTAANAFANATLSQTGGTLLLAPQGGGDVVIPDLGGSGGDITIDVGASAVFGSNSNRGYDGRIRGQGAFKKEGNGILTLNADNDFAGNTRIAQGRLKLGAAGALSATPRIDIDGGAIFDVADRGDFTLGNGQRLGGRGTVLGSLQFGGGAQFAFDPTGPLLVGSGTVSFASDFGIGSIFGLDANVAEGTYTLLNETTGGSISFTNLANVGPGNPFDLGGGKTAYFQQGSLQVVVVPEPDTFIIGGLVLALAGLMTTRRGRTTAA